MHSNSSDAGCREPMSSKPCRSKRQGRPFISLPHVVAVLAATLWTFAPVASAQVCGPSARPVTVLTPNPTTQTPITLLVWAYASEACSTLTYRVEGNLIIVEADWMCLHQPAFGDRQLSIGTLPSGSYEVRVYDRAGIVAGEPPISCGTFMVAAATLEPIPMLSASSIAGFALLISLFGFLVVRRAT